MPDELVLVDEGPSGTLTFAGVATDDALTLNEPSATVPDTLDNGPDAPTGLLTFAEVPNTGDVLFSDPTGPRGPTGPAGAPGTGVGSTVTALEAVQALHVVALDEDGLAYMASSSDVLDAPRILGVSLTAATTGEDFIAITDGVMETAAIWTPGPLYLGADGQLTPTPVTLGFSLEVAQAVTTSRLIVRPQFPIFL